MIIDAVVTLGTNEVEATATNDISVTVTLNDTIENPSATFCEKVDECLGISPSGDATKYLNEKGEWVVVSGGGWKLTGNSGTDSDSNFIGTTDEEDFVIRTNNIEAARIYANQGFKFTTEIGNGVHELSCRDNNVFGASVFTQRYVDNVANYTTLISNGDASPYGGGTSDLTLSCFKNDFSKVASLDVHRDAFGNPTIYGSSRIGGNFSEFGVSSEQGVKIGTQYNGNNSGFLGNADYAQIEYNNIRCRVDEDGISHNQNGNILNQFDNSGFIYIGSESVDGSWRFATSSGNLVIEKRESGSWVTKQTLV